MFNKFNQIFQICFYLCYYSYSIITIKLINDTTLLITIPIKYLYIIGANYFIVNMSNILYALILLLDSIGITGRSTTYNIQGSFIP